MGPEGGPRAGGSPGPLAPSRAGPGDALPSRLLRRAGYLLAAAEAASASFSILAFGLSLALAILGDVPGSELFLRFFLVDLLVGYEARRVPVLVRAGQVGRALALARSWAVLGRCSGWSCRGS